MVVALGGAVLGSVDLEVLAAPFPANLEGRGGLLSSLSGPLPWPNSQNQRARSADHPWRPLEAQNLWSPGFSAMLWVPEYELGTGVSASLTHLSLT